MPLGRPKRARTASKTPQDEGQLFSGTGRYLKTNCFLNKGKSQPNQCWGFAHEGSQTPEHPQLPPVARSAPGPASHHPARLTPSFTLAQRSHLSS